MKGDDTRVEGRFLDAAFYDNVLRSVSDIEAAKRPLTQLLEYLCVLSGSLRANDRIHKGRDAVKNSTNLD